MNTDTYPLLTIIIAVFNGDKTIQQCIDSVALQSYPHKQLIIIDGGSTDDTVQLLQENNDVINYWVSEPDNGIYNAWNKGLIKANGEWVCFLGADDYLWNEHVLEEITSQLVNIPEDINIVYGQIMILTNNEVALYSIGESWDKIKTRFKQLMCIPHQAVMHRKVLFEKNGLFDESFRIAGDYEWLLRELKTNNALFMPDLIITGMRQGGVSSDPSNTLTTMREIRRAQKMHGQSFPGWLWLMAMARVHIRLFLCSLLGDQTTKKILDRYRVIKGLPTYWTKI